MESNRQSGSHGAESAAAVAMVAGTERSLQVAKLLVGALGTPQVIVTRSGEPAPPSVRIGILLDERAAAPALPEAGIWRLADAPHALHSQYAVEASIASDCARRAQLPTDLIHCLAVTHDRNATPLDNASLLMWYYASKRLRKSPRLPADARGSELDAAIVLLSGERDGAQLVRLLVDGATQTDATRTLEANGSAIRVDDARHPETIFTYAAGASLAPNEQSTLVSRLQHWLPRLTRARDLAWAAGAAHLLGDANNFDKAVSRLLESDLYDNATGCVRSESAGTAYCYSPLLAAVLLLACRRMDSQWRPRTERSRRDPLPYRVFRFTTHDALHLFLDRDRRFISRTIFDNWRRLHTAPDTGGWQYELGSGSYIRTTCDLEAVWIAIIRSLILDSGQPFVRLHPWPRSSTFALSLRYDIDRPTLLEQAASIIDIQRNIIGTMCGSWYVMNASDHICAIERLLVENEQELGLHAHRADEPVQGRGVTFHSAPSSEYWRGQESNLTLEGGGARYSEMLATQFCTPRLGWIEEAGGGRPTAMPLTPLHFPLEGTTADTTLDYFDRLLCEFRSLRDCGGHVIIASHPDLNQDLLAELLHREDFGNAWCAPVGTVVDRCHRILSYGRTALTREDGQLAFALVSESEIEDLQVSIDDGRTVAASSLTLPAGQPVVLQRPAAPSASACD